MAREEAPAQKRKRERASSVRMARAVSVLLMKTCTAGRSGSTPSSSALRKDSSTSAAADSS